MNMCSDCKSQQSKGRYDKPHSYLTSTGDVKGFRGGMFGGYEEEKYRCNKCQSVFIHSNDKNDNGWMIVES